MSGTATRRILVNDLIIVCEIGVSPHEHGKYQRVRVNLELDMADGDAPLHDDLRKTVSYSDIIARLQAMVVTGRVNLAETLAERIAALCLEDRRVRKARVRIEKLDIYPDGASVGVEIERFNQLV